MSERGAMQILGIDHVQLAMPVGEEDKARAFYSGLLGIPEVPKPAALAQRGGVWFQRGNVKIHLGVESAFRPALKAHPALLVRDLRTLVRRLGEAGVHVIEDDGLPGYERVYASDPFGNRLELMEERSLPIVCTLKPGELEARRDGLLPGLLAKARAQERMPGGFRWRFEPDAHLAEEVGAVIDAEHQCCRFLRFQLLVEPGDGPMWLEVTGPQGTEEFLSALR